MDFNDYEERLQESRMREIRTSGLTRGSNGIGVNRPLLSTLLVCISVFCTRTRAARGVEAGASHGVRLSEPLRELILKSLPHLRFHFGFKGNGIIGIRRDPPPPEVLKISGFRRQFGKM